MRAKITDMQQNCPSRWIKLVSIALGLLLTGQICAGENRAEIEMCFQQGLNQYAGCRMIDPWNTPQKRAKGTVNKCTIVFSDLKLPGKDVKIESARLEMDFCEEGWGKVRDAKLQLHDATGKETPVLSTAEYRNKKFPGLTKKNRIVRWSIPATLVRQWVSKPDTNKGLRFSVIPGMKGRFQFVFNLDKSKVAERRPRLIVKYSFAGNAKPFQPTITTRLDGKTFGPRFSLTWKKKERWDPNGTPVKYEIAVGEEGGKFKTAATVAAAACGAELDTAQLNTAKQYQVRVRSLDPEGLKSDWTTVPGSFKVTRESFVIWTESSVTKVQKEQSPPTQPRAVSVSGAQNEFESFQIVTSALSNLQDVDVTVGALTGPGGATIPASAFCLYRINYVDCEAQGWLPDSMVPFVNPLTGKRIGGTYGAPFEVAAGTNVATWVELHIPAKAKPGVYSGKAVVSIGSKSVKEIPIKTTVWPITLPRTTSLLTYFELAYTKHKKRAYLHSLHNHRIDVWFVNGYGPDFKRDENGKAVVVWTPEFDKLLESYFNGSLFADGIPGKSYLLGYGTWKLLDALKKSDADRIEILKQTEAHFKDKPYVDKLAWFFIDEPNKKTIATCIKVGKQIKEHSPSIKFLLTTGFRKDLVGLVDIWDPINSHEIFNWNAPGIDVYRNEIKQGRMAINCITVNSNSPTSPNLFIHRGGMNVRIWTWSTYCMGLQGIEFWRANPAPSVTKPKKYGSAWGDGSLFYCGLPDELGIPEEIALPSIRLKMLRDGIEDFELLSMLRKKNPTLAMKLCRQMCQETKLYDKSFAKPVQTVSGGQIGKQWRKDVPGKLIWESSPERLATTRARIAVAISQD